LVTDFSEETMLKKLITLTAITGALALPALADDANTNANPSRPDLNQPTEQMPSSDQKARDIEQDRGFGDTGAGTSTGVKAPAAPAANVPKVGAREGDVGGLTDDEVLSRIHAIDQQEIDLANVAMQKGQLAQVKNFAQMMIKDHQKADADLQKFAKEKGITLREPRALNDADQKSMQDDKQVAAQVRNASGAQFDSIYANAMLQGHADAIGMIEEAVKETKTPAVKGFYEKLLPTLRMHRDHAADIVATIQTEGVGGTSGSMTGAGSSTEDMPSGDVDQKSDTGRDVNKDKDQKKIDKDYGKKSDQRSDQ